MEISHIVYVVMHVRLTPNVVTDLIMAVEKFHVFDIQIMSECKPCLISIHYYVTKSLSQMRIQ